MKMKLFAAAAVVACTMSAAPAFAGDGFVDGAYMHVNSSLLAGSFTAYQINGAYSTEPATGAIGFQGDLGYTDADGLPDGVISGTATVYHQGEKTRLGAYGRYTDAGGLTGWEAGAVGQVLNENFTLTGSLGYGDTDAAGASSTWTMAAAASFYLNKNVALTGFGSFSDPEFLGGSAHTVGVSLEVKPESLPISVFAAYSRADAGPTVDVISVGARFNFGGKTLKDRDQKAVLRNIGGRASF